MTFEEFEQSYTDWEEIGSGGFGDVFKAWDQSKLRYVAIKRGRVRSDLEQYSLLNEVKLVNELPPHPNVARYEDCHRFNLGLFGETDFAILKYYAHGNLEQFLQKNTLDEREKQTLITGILRGIQYLHSNNIIHRDLKSQNILLEFEDGVWMPKITDFGLGRFLDGENTDSVAKALTFAYAAPEQIQGGKIYKNVDLWAAGVIIYRVIAGELPFQGKPGGTDRSTQSQVELSRKIVNLELPDAIHSLPEPYQAIIKRCLVLDPKERVQSGADLLRMLTGSSDDASTDIHPIQPIPPHSSDGMDQSQHTQVMGPEPKDSNMTAVMTPESKSGQGVDPPAWDNPYSSAEPVSRGGYQEPSNPDRSELYIDPPSYGLDHAVPSSSVPVPSSRPPSAAPPPRQPPEPARLVQGESRKKGKKGLIIFLWLIGFLLIGGMAYGGYIWYSDFQNAQKKSRYKPKGYIRVHSFSEIQKLNEEAQNDTKEIERVHGLIMENIKNSTIPDYRRLYELAKNRSFAGKTEKMKEALKFAGKIALETNRSKEFLKEVNSDAHNVFRQFKSSFPKQYEYLKKALENNNKQYLRLDEW